MITLYAYEIMCNTQKDIVNRFSFCITFFKRGGGKKKREIRYWRERIQNQLRFQMVSKACEVVRERIRKKMIARGKITHSQEDNELGLFSQLLYLINNFKGLGLPCS